MVRNMIDIIVNFVLMFKVSGLNFTLILIPYIF